MALCLMAVGLVLVPATSAGRNMPMASPVASVVSTASVPGAGSLSGTWTMFAPTSGQPFARTGAALAFDPVEGLGVLFGGRAANSSLLNDTWVNDGDYPGEWGSTPVPDIVSPPPLLDAALTFDPTFNEFLLFGGKLANGTAYGGTWSFGGFQWTDLTGNLRTSPPPDPSPAIAYDALTGEVVLVSSSDPGATWTFGAGGWTDLPIAEWLAPRTAPTALADPSTGGVLLFGGSTIGSEPQPLNATWMFLSSGWEPVTSGTAPPPEARPAMAYDPRIPGVLLFSSTSTVSTWVYTSTGWSEWPGGTMPPARAGAELYYDSDADYDSLFGGAAVNGSTFSDNWGWSVPPVVLTPTLGAASIGFTTWVEVAAVIAVPIAVVLILRRRPPRTKPVDAPASAAAAAPS